MRLAEFGEGGSVNPDAICQQGALIMCLYWNQQGKAQQLLNNFGGGTILRWDFQKNTTLVSSAVIEQGDRLYVILSGTSNWKQASGDVLGAVGRKYGSGDVLVHVYFDNVAQRLHKPIRDAMPSDLTGKKIYVSGHSLGAGSGFLLALAFSASDGEENVSFLGIEMPKTLTEQLSAPLPHHCFRVSTPEDPVPFLPAGPINFKGVSKFEKDSGTTWVWTHYGQGFHLTKDLQLVEQSFDNPGTWLDYRRVVSGDFELHRIVNVGKRLAEWYSQTAPDKQAVAKLVPIINALRDLPEPSDDTEEIDLTNYIPFTDVNTVYFGSWGKVLDKTNYKEMQSVTLSYREINNSVSQNIGNFLSFSRSTKNMAVYKLTLNINNSRYGESFSVYHNTDQGWDGAILAAKDLADIRSNLFGCSKTLAAYSKDLGNPHVDGIRVSLASTPKVGVNRDLDSAQYAGFKTNLGGYEANAADAAMVGLSVTIPSVNSTDANKTSNSHHLLNFNADAVCHGGVYKGNSVLIRNQETYDYWLSKFLAYLTNPKNGLGHIGVKSDATADAGDKSKTIVSFSLTADNKWRMVVPSHGWVDGDKIKITSCDKSVFNKTYKIKLIAATSEIPDGTVELSRGPSRAEDVPSIGTARRVQKASGERVFDFYKFVTPVGGWASPYGVRVKPKGKLGLEITPFRGRGRGKDKSR